MAKLEFYFAPGACSLATHIALVESGAAFTAKPISLRKGMQYTPDYLALNPKGKVPLLVVDGKPLTENVAILSYLNRTHPQAKLLPAGDPMREAEALSFIAWCTSGVHPVLSRFFGPQKFCDLPDSTANVVKLATEANAKNFALIDKMLAGRDWVFGEWSVADGYIFVFFSWAQKLKIDTSAFPNYAKHFERMSQRPSVQKALDNEKNAQGELDKAA